MKGRKGLDEDEEDESDGDEEGGAMDGDDDRDYTYKELLDRVFAKILKDRPELQDKKRSVPNPRNPFRLLLWHCRT